MAAAPAPQPVDPKSPPARPRGRLALTLFVGLAAALAFALVFTAFAPRLLFWQLVDLSPSPTNPPDVNRAIDTLRQVEDPGVRITTPTNRVINWRLLFPALAHYLHLSRTAFLALPFVGVFLALAYAGWVVAVGSGDRRLAFLATALAGTASWFFVSTGWLAYFDAWYVLGMLLASFTPSRWILFLVALLSPWVDERFLLALPLCLVVRGIGLGMGWGAGQGREPGRIKVGSRLMGELGLCVLAAFPYVAVRLASLALDRHESSAAHVKEHLATLPGFGSLLEGLWFGLRLDWAFVAVAVAATFVRRGSLWGVGLFLMILATLATNLAMAHDLSRSVSTLMPVVVLGMVLLARSPRRHVAWIFAGLLLGNLALPAAHVVAGWDDRIRLHNLFSEWKGYTMPSSLSAEVAVSRGKSYMERKELPKALECFEKAVRDFPDLAQGHLQLGMCLHRMERLNEAEEAFSVAVKRFPDEPMFVYFRGLVRFSLGMEAGAERDLQRALDLAPPGAYFRPDTEQKLAQLRARAAKASPR
ncbi:tetratricopeptide repeat protein [Singulisphaera sp. PoT]|uniref:tetratricopeptide repeat protein n=1 Tax=Singulisphaera sp. PoT TaxID=3411797 RepID=UPI003BF53A91